MDGWMKGWENGCLDLQGHVLMIEEGGIVGKEADQVGDQ